MQEHPMPTPKEPAQYERLVLAGMQRQSHIYGGTVPAETVAKRRSANRVARKSRRMNRTR